ncbi:MAG: efflux RND transporter permease subunit, partial [Gemmatimonadales bacterium]
MAHKSDTWMIENIHNTARFFTENRHIAWMTLVATLLWGVFGYFRMPQRKDPDIPVKVAMAICRWPGVEATRVEELVARRIEETMAENVTVKEITSTSRLGVAFVWVTLKDEVDDPAKELDDIKLRLDGIPDLPQGAGPIDFIRDFGSTAALMLTVASPPAGDAVIGIRARAIRDTLVRLRSAASRGEPRVALIYNGPAEVTEDMVRPMVDLFIRQAAADGTLHDARMVFGPGFVGVDGVTALTDTALETYTRGFTERTLRSSEFHPDSWPLVVIRDPAATATKLREHPGEKYSYHELDQYTDLIRRSLQGIPMVTKVSRSGVLDEQVTLTYSQERLASYGVGDQRLRDVLSARNIPAAAGALEVQGKTVAVTATGEFRNAREIGDVIVGASRTGAPLYLRDLVQISREYRTPATYVNYFSAPGGEGQWGRHRAVTLAVEMRAGAKIGEFGAAVDSALDRLRERLPEDLIMARTSDQPRQVEESVDLFMDSLIEAIGLVVVVALIGFWEWRSALVMALAIPLTLAMTFGMMSVLGIDLQQVSIASLIIALGLLVDDPVVAGDAIKRDLAAGHRPIIASWLGPTKLATAIVFATITNIVAYLPFLMLTGDTGRFLYSLPVVLTCSLVSSRLVSMTFIPLLGYYLLRPQGGPEQSAAARRTVGFAGWYYRVGRAAIEHRRLVLVGAAGILVLGGLVGRQLKSQFFPKDLSYFSTVDVWLPEDASVTATQEAARHTEELIRQTAAGLERHGGEHGAVLRSLTTFVGGGGPRFWASLSPEPRQANYAQIIIEVIDKHDTRPLIEALQPVVSAEIAGARVTAKELEVGSPVGIPVSIRIVGDDIPTLRAAGERLRQLFLGIPIATQVQDDWGAEGFAVRMDIDPDRAALAGVTNADIASSAAAALNGYEVGVLRDGHQQIPIVGRLRMEERADLGDLQNLYVASSQTGHR